jgi:HEAT repeat protein
MAKSDPIERSLDRLGELRHAEASETAVEEVRQFLRNRSNLIVSKAAKVVRELQLKALIPDLVAAFSKLMKDGPRLDKRCAAVTEIVSALYELNYQEPEPYLAGLKHVQMEASFGPPVDEAAKLRAVSAQGLVRTRHPDALTEVTQLLVDREPAARLGAVRALAANGGEAGILLLKLKVLTGDVEPAVIGECFSGLLEASPAKSVPFVAKYIDSDDDDVAQAAMLALGESRLPAAFEVLREKWARTIAMPVRRVLLSAMAASKLDEAIAFLVSLVETASVPTAAAAVEALSIYSRNERVRKSVGDAVSVRSDKTLLERFRQDFEA